MIMTTAQRDLLTKLEQGATCLTATSRLALMLGKEFDNWQRAQGKSVWEAPAIHPMGSWLTERFSACQHRGLASDYQLLTSEQASHVWQALTREHLSALVHHASVAKQCQSAYELCLIYEVDWNSAPFSLSAESTLFQTLANAFQQRCQDNHWLIQVELPRVLARAIDECRLPMQELLLTGFDELPPLLSPLLNTLGKANWQLFPFAAHTPQVIRVAPLDETQEIDAMIAFVKQALQAPNTTIGCIVPNLTEKRAELESAFAKALAPETRALGQYDFTPVYTISAGTSLRSHSLARQALNLLHCVHKQTDVTTVIETLTSPYLDKASIKRQARYECARFIEENYCLPLSSDDFVNALKQKGKYAKQSFDEELAEQFNKANTLTPIVEAAPSTFAYCFKTQLETLGWPGQRALNTNEFQLASAIAGLFDKLASFDSLYDSLNLSEALRLLDELYSSSIFQFKSHQPRVHVLGVLEAAGLDFDSCWVMGLHAGVWPTAAKPNAFIPLSLQRKHGMPHATAEREITYCETITARLCTSASEQVIISAPKMADELDVEPSPLITELPLTELSALVSLEANVLSPVALECYEETAVPAVDEKTTLSGGSAILKHQAACAFKAFIAARLGTRAIMPRQFGFNAMERGIICHRALELLWQQLESHHRLVSMPQNQLMEKISQAVNQALNELCRKSFQKIIKANRQAEQERLENLLLNWCEFEKTREPFTVEAIEQRYQTEFAGLTLRLAIDRIDRLASGERVLLDYKTGKVTSRDWLGERPSDPQLPLYCLTTIGDVSGIAYASLKPNDLKFQGITKGEEVLPGVKSADKQRKEAHGWDTQLDEWQDSLSALADEFIQGFIALNPKSGAATCLHCDFASICRIHEVDEASV